MPGTVILITNFDEAKFYYRYAPKFTYSATQRKKVFENQSCEIHKEIESCNERFSGFTKQ